MHTRRRRAQLPNSHAPPPPQVLEDEMYEGYDYADGDKELLLYLDSADVKQWERWADAGIFYGGSGRRGRCSCVWGAGPG